MQHEIFYVGTNVMWYGLPNDELTQNFNPGSSLFVFKNLNTNNFSKYQENYYEIFKTPANMNMTAQKCW
jgi:hypothetical protein